MGIARVAGAAQADYGDEGHESDDDPETENELQDTEEDRASLVLLRKNS